VLTARKFSTVWNTSDLAVALSPTLNWRRRSMSTDLMSINFTPSSRWDAEKQVGNYHQLLTLPPKSNKRHFDNPQNCLAPKRLVPWLERRSLHGHCSLRKRTILFKTLRIGPTRIVIRSARNRAVSLGPHGFLVLQIVATRLYGSLLVAFYLIFFLFRVPQAKRYLWTLQTQTDGQHSRSMQYTALCIPTGFPFSSFLRQFPVLLHAVEIG